MTRWQALFEKSVEAERRSPFTKTIREQAMLLAALMLNESGIIRVCASCEEEVGPQVGDDNDKSHTYCKRHSLEMLHSIGADALAAKYAERPEEEFAPDLSKHPELVDHGRAEEWRRNRAAQRAASNQELAQRI